MPPQWNLKLISADHAPASLSSLLIITDRFRIPMPVSTVLVLPSYPLAMIRWAGSTVVSLVVRTALPVVMVVARTMPATRVPMATVSILIHHLLIFPLLRELLLTSCLHPRVVATLASIVPAQIIGIVYFSLVVAPIIKAMSIDLLVVTTAALVFVFDKALFLVAFILSEAWRSRVFIFVMSASGFVPLVRVFNKSLFKIVPEAHG